MEYIIVMHWRCFVQEQIGQGVWDGIWRFSATGGVDTTNRRIDHLEQDKLDSFIMCDGFGLHEGEREEYALDDARCVSRLSGVWLVTDRTKDTRDVEYHA